MNIPYLAFVPLPTRIAPLRPPHPARASHRWHTHMLLRHPPPRPRCALLPRPHPGARAVRAIPGGKPRQGVVLTPVSREKGERARTRFLPRISPCSGPWWISPRGEGTGEGARPLPGQNDTRKFLSGNPHPARPSVSSPTRGAGAVRGDIRWEAVPGSSADVGFPEDREESASENRLETGSSPVPPRAVDRGGYRPRGWGPGRGSPPSRRRVPVCSSSKPPPPRRGGQYVGIPGKSRLPGCKTPG